MSNVLYRMGRSAASRPWTVLGAWMVAAVVVIGASSAFGRELEDSFEVPGLDSQRAVELLSAAGADEAGLTAQVVATPRDPDATFFDSPDARAALAELRADVLGADSVVATTDPAATLDAGPDEAVASGTVSPDGRVALIRVQYPVLEDLAPTDLESLQAVLASADDDPHVRVEAGGDLFFAFAEPETGGGEIIGLVAAVVILIVAFGSLVAMGLPIGMALFGLALGVSSMSLVAYLVEIPSWAPILASMVGLGVGIDYALFVVTRHREQLLAGLDVVHSAGLAVATAGQAVVFAGGTVVIAILGLAVAGVPFVTAGGIAISLVVAIMVVATVTLLPAFLGLAGHRVIRLRLRGRRPFGSNDTAAIGTVSPRWQAWGRHVSRHAVAYAVGVTALLLALTAPVLALRLGLPDDGTLAEHRTERQAYDLVAEGFGPGTNGPVLVAVDLNDDPAVIEPLVEAVAADPGIVGVAPPQVDPDSGVAILVAIPTTAPQDEATFETITRLRADVLPTVLDASPATGHVGGQTASFADVGNQVGERMPYFIAAVVLLSFVLLTLVFRSIVVPVKAAILNLLSIGASYGVLVMVFQWGWGKELIGLETTIPIVSFIPLFMFGILFGLSMDYEVFLLSRVREEYLRSGDNEASVIHGIAGTARVITSAALIMVSVFTGFTLSSDPSTKMFGLGLAVAIAVDASIVRLVLVPATMKLMGDANWWFPAWLDRILPRVDMEAAPTVDAEEPQGRDLVEVN